MCATSVTPRCLCRATVMLTSMCNVCDFELLRGFVVAVVACATVLCFAGVCLRFEYVGHVSRIFLVGIAAERQPRSDGYVVRVQ